MKVAIFLGSESDGDLVQEAAEVLQEFGIPFGIEVTSAHRTPQRTVEMVKKLEEQGVEVFIAVAGMAAHLAGVVASHTLRPVIGVPAPGALGGLDALLSTVQMPQGVPVASMGIGKPGAVNAALLAIAILSLKDASLTARLKEYREKMARQVEESSARIKEKL